MVSLRRGRENARTRRAGPLPSPCSLLAWGSPVTTPTRDRAPHRVLIESPFAGNVSENIAYARRCLLDSLTRGEAPFASHLLYTQVLDDRAEAERETGLQAASAWLEVADLVACYYDRGISGGMRAGLARARALRKRILFRSLDQLPALPDTWLHENGVHHEPSECLLCVRARAEP
jgi:hypothetical protein